MIGQLYDGSNDQIIYGATLWYPNDTVVDVNNVLNTRSKVYIDENVLDRLDYMDVDASLKLSFMGGLISVSQTNQFLIFAIRSLPFVKPVFCNNVIPG